MSAGGRADSQTRFAYFYLMKADSDAVRVVAPRHASYWRELRLSHYVGGPFEDRTGGLITFDAADATEAERAVRGDPFLLQELVEAHWIKRWARESPIGPPAARDARRPLLGLRRKPGRLALAFFRMPLNAYRHDAGSVMGHTFLEFTHTGRKTGRPYDAVAMVLRYDEATRRPSSLPHGDRRRTGCATFAPVPPSRCSWDVSRSSLSIGSSARRKPSTSSFSSAASTRTGCG